MIFYLNIMYSALCACFYNIIYFIMVNIYLKRFNMFLLDHDVSGSTVPYKCQTRGMGHM